jgi:hypothetical protein
VLLGGDDGGFFSRLDRRNQERKRLLRLLRTGSPAVEGDSAAAGSNGSCVLSLLRVCEKERIEIGDVVRRSCFDPLLSCGQQPGGCKRVIPRGIRIIFHTKLPWPSRLKQNKSTALVSSVYNGAEEP